MINEEKLERELDKVNEEIQVENGDDGPSEVNMQQHVLHSRTEYSKHNDHNDN